MRVSSSLRLVYFIHTLRIIYDSQIYQKKSVKNFSSKFVDPGFLANRIDKLVVCHDTDLVIESPQNAIGPNRFKERLEWIIEMCFFKSRYSKPDINACVCIPDSFGQWS